MECKHILTIIDIFSKYAWAVPVRNKIGLSITEAFKIITKDSKRKPEKLWVDQGSEFYDKMFKDWLKQNDIEMYSTFNEGKAVVIERFNRTLKTRMWKRFTMNNNLEMLPKLIDRYNNTKHSSIKITSIEASKKKNEGIAYFNLYGDLEPSTKKPKFKVGDRVRISKYKKTFEQGFPSNFGEEIFIVDKIVYSNPITYQIRDFNNETIRGSFYEHELQIAKQDVFRIDKVTSEEGPGG